MTAPLINRPNTFTPRMMVHYLHAVLTDPAQGVADRFSEYLHVERRLDHVIAVVSALRRDEWLKGPEDTRLLIFRNGPPRRRLRKLPML